MVNRYDSLSGMTPLRIAIGAKDLSLVEFFLTFENISLNDRDENGWTVLHAAAAQGSDKLLSVRPSPSSYSFLYANFDPICPSNQVK